MKTVLFQKSDFAGRQAGFLTTWMDGANYQKSHYCVVVSEDLFMNLRYNRSTVAGEDGTDQPIYIPKNCTYIIDIERLKSEYPACEYAAVEIADASIVQEVPLG